VHRGGCGGGHGRTRGDGGGQAALDIECLDRVYFNAYVPILQSSGQVVAFMTQYLGLPIPSPALFDKIGQKFRRPVASFAEANHIPWVKFAKDDRKADVTAQYLKQAAAGGRSQVAAIARQGMLEHERLSAATEPIVGQSEHERI
jgi:hypothetical protein